MINKLKKLYNTDSMIGIQGKPIQELQLESTDSNSQSNEMISKNLVNRYDDL